MNTHPNAQPEDRSLCPDLPPEGTVTAELSLQEASLVRVLLSNFLRSGGFAGQSERARTHMSMSALTALKELAGPRVNPGLPSRVERTWPEGTTFYQFTTFDMEELAEYNAFLPTTEAITDYLFTHKRRKADEVLVADLTTHGNRFATEAPVGVVETHLDVNTTKVAWNPRHPDMLVDYKAKLLNHFALTLATPPSEEKVLGTFAITP